MDDGFARDGVLTRCNQDRDATSNDVECANARRAAAAIALEAERARAGQLERQSEGARLALGGQQRAGAPSFEVYADGSDSLARPTLEIEAKPPANDLVIATPKIELTDLTAVPRPFQSAAAE